MTINEILCNAYDAEGNKIDIPKGMSRIYGKEGFVDIKSQGYSAEFVYRPNHISEKPIAIDAWIKKI